MEAANRIKDQMKQTQAMRRERRKAEREKLARDIELAEAHAKVVAERLEQERQEKERQLNERLAALKAKREERELEYLIGERRAMKILHAKNLSDVMKEQFDDRMRDEQAIKEAAWEKKRATLRGPVVDGLDDVARRIKETEERRLQRMEELRLSWKELEEQQRGHYHQGASYELAVDEYLKSKHKEDDVQHNRRYRHAKMQEYGRIVRAMQDAAATELTQQSGPSLTPRTSPRARRNTRNDDTVVMSNGAPPPGQPFFDPSPSAQRHGLPQPVMPKASLTPAERNKHGNGFLKEAIKLKSVTPLPPGLRVAPLDEARRKQEHDRFVLRKQKGDAYLRDLRQMGLVKAPQYDDEYEFIGDVRRLKSKVHRLENECLFDEGHPGAASPPAPPHSSPSASLMSKGNLASSSPSSSVARRHTAHDLDDPELGLRRNERMLEMVQTKIALLQRIDRHH